MFELLSGLSFNMGLSEARLPFWTQITVSVLYLPYLPHGWLYAPIFTFLVTHTPLQYIPVTVAFPSVMPQRLFARLVLYLHPHTSSWWLVSPWYLQRQITLHYLLVTLCYLNIAAMYGILILDGWVSWFSWFTIWNRPVFPGWTWPIVPYRLVI